MLKRLKQCNLQRAVRRAEPPNHLARHGTPLSKTQGHFQLITEVDARDRLTFTATSSASTRSNARQTSLKPPFPSRFRRTYLQQSNSNERACGRLVERKGQIRCQVNVTTTIAMQLCTKHALSEGDHLRVYGSASERASWSAGKPSCAAVFTPTSMRVKTDYPLSLATFACLPPSAPSLKATERAYLPLRVGRLANLERSSCATRFSSRMCSTLRASKARFSSCFKSRQHGSGEEVGG